MVAWWGASQPEVLNTTCAACMKAKNMLRLVGVGRSELSSTMWALSRPHTAGRIPWRRCPRDKATNQPGKLMQKMPQKDSCFAEWYPLVKEQAERCIWVGYNGSMAARVQGQAGALWDQPEPGGHGPV